MTHRRGFTLTEMLVAMAAGSVLLLAAAVMMDRTSAGYLRLGGAVDAEREARGLLSQLAADLENACDHPDGVFEASTAGWPADKLGFLYLRPAHGQAADRRIGDLCAVNYALRDVSINGKTVRCLMRGGMESAATFQALDHDTLHASLARPGDRDEPVAFAVVAFSARPLARDAAGQWGDWAPGGTTGPEALDVRLVLARRELAAKLRTPADWDGAGAAARLLGPPAAAARNRDLEIFATRLPYGNHDHPPIAKP